MKEEDVRALLCALEEAGLDSKLAKAIVDLMLKIVSDFVTRDELMLILRGELANFGIELRKEIWAENKRLYDDARAENKQLHDDARAERKELRDEFLGETKEIRDENEKFRVEIRNLVNNALVQIEALRGETSTGLEKVRTDMEKLFGKFYEKMWKLMFGAIAALAGLLSIIVALIGLFG